MRHFPNANRVLAGVCAMPPPERSDSSQMTTLAAIKAWVIQGRGLSAWSFSANCRSAANWLVRIRDGRHLAGGIQAAVDGVEQALAVGIVERRRGSATLPAHG